LTQRLRFLLDTNVLIPLQDSLLILKDNLANFVHLANLNGHTLLYHPATIADFERDADVQRREQNLQRIKMYPALQNVAPCPWNTKATGANDSCDNEILYALECDAVHALITEDRRLHAKARKRELDNRVYTIQTAEDWLRRLHETHQVILPNIEDVPLHQLTPLLSSAFFDSLRNGYSNFNEWFRSKAREGRNAWIYKDENDTLAAICIYAEQINQKITDSGEQLPGRALKLCTFKVGEAVRGRKIGELFLKAAFRYATDNSCEHLFIHVDSGKHDYLINLLHDFGFESRGAYNNDLVLVKQHPKTAPADNTLKPFDYARKFFPHFRHDAQVKKFLIPIRPEFHEILFPDYIPIQKRLFNMIGNVGNAIKLAYLCHAQTNAVHLGDIVLFYRTHDEKSVTSIGVVERFEVLNDAAKVAALVSRRTVYTIDEIEEMAKCKTKVILFRLVEHLSHPLTYDYLTREKIVTGPIRSICKISNASFSKVLIAAGK